MIRDGPEHTTVTGGVVAVVITVALIYNENMLQRKTSTIPTSMAEDRNPSTEEKQYPPGRARKQPATGTTSESLNEYTDHLPCLNIHLM